MGKPDEIIFNDSEAKKKLENILQEDEVVCRHSNQHESDLLLK